MRNHSRNPSLPIGRAAECSALREAKCMPLRCSDTAPASPMRRGIGAAAPPRPPRIGLALGGGAARGFAHIGVIQVLEEQSAGFVARYQERLHAAKAAA